jgi:hypothetical protein
MALVWLFELLRYHGFSQVPVAHTCHPSYSEGIDQEDHGLKPAQTNSSARPYLEKPFTKIGLMEWLRVKALNSSPSTNQSISQ